MWISDLKIAKDLRFVNDECPLYNQTSDKKKYLRSVDDQRSTICGKSSIYDLLVVEYLRIVEDLRIANDLRSVNSQG